MKSTCCDTRATESIIKSGQKDTKATGRKNVNPLSLPDTIEIANPCGLHA